MDNKDIQESNSVEEMNPGDANRQEVQIETAETKEERYTGPLKRKVYSGMWGPLELGIVAVGAFLLLISGLFYLLFVIPANSELASDRSKRDDLDVKLRESRKKYGGMTNTQDQALKLVESSEDFEFRALRPQTVGTSAVYQRLNALIRSYDLRNTSGPDYEPLVAGTGNKNSEEETGRDKFRSIFPGIYITTTVEGPYPNLRRFIRDLESSREFVAITAVELEPSDEGDAEPQTKTVETLENGQKVQKTVRLGRYRGNRVNLRIEMAAYFRRPGVEPTRTSASEVLEDSLQGGQQ